MKNAVRVLFGSSLAVKQVTVNHPSAGSNPASRTERRTHQVRRVRRMVKAADCKSATHRVNAGGSNPPLTTIGTVDQLAESPA